MTESKAKVLKAPPGFCSPKVVVSCWADLFVHSTNNLQQEKEDLDDVNVDGERGEHVLLRADGVLPVSYQELRVVRQELQDTQQTLTVKHSVRA